jgi:hypothetical protein
MRTQTKREVLHGAPSTGVARAYTSRSQHICKAVGDYCAHMSISIQKLNVICLTCDQNGTCFNHATLAIHSHERHMRDRYGR